MELHKRMKEESLSLLVSIVTGHDALSKVKSFEGDLRKLEQYLYVEYKALDAGSNDESQAGCDCWYENEYFDYVDCNEPANIRNQQFNKIIDRIMNGKCEHVIDDATGERSDDGGQITDDANIAAFLRNPRNCSLTQAAVTRCSNKSDDVTNVSTCRDRNSTFISYLHAAAAVGDTELVEYLCRKYPDYRTVRTSSGLVAFHLAVLKQHVHTMKSLHNETVPIVKERLGFSFRKIRSQPLSYYFNLNEYQSQHESGLRLPVKIYSRSSVSNKVTEVELGAYNIKSPMIALLKCIDHPRSDLLLECTNYLEDRQKSDIMIHVLIKGHEDGAIEVLKTTPKEHISLAVKVASILTDSDRFLDGIIHAGANMLMSDLDYSLQDLAEAVWSFKCFDLLRKKNGRRKMSCRCKADVRKQPLSVLFCYGALTIQYLGRDFVLGFLDKIQKKGFNVNRRDAEWLTPLQYVLIKPQKYIIQTSVKCDFASRLIELGANVEVLDDEYKSILSHFVRFPRSRGVGFETISIIHLLLYYNSTPRCIDSDNMLYYCHKFDCTRYDSLMVRFIIPLDDSDMGNSDHHEILNKTYQKSLFAVMFEFGFGLRSSDKHINDTKELLWPVFYERVYTQPKSLKSLCRITFRCSNPGIKLFKMLEHYILPSSIKNYLLAKDLLSSELFQVNTGDTRYLDIG